jgi:hypothetical protein
MRIQHRVGTLIGLALLVATAAPAAAQDAETLRKELEQLRKQFQDVQQQYQKSIDALSDRLQRLEAQPRPVATPPTPSPPAPTTLAQQAPTAPPPSAPSAMDLLRPREPYSLYGQRGPGQLLFDIGVVGDFIGNFTSNKVERAGAGTFVGRENRVLPREIEVNLFGRIDPYAEGVVRFEFAEEFENGERVTEAKLAEAYLTLLTLPFGTRLSLGQVPVLFGALSHVHREALPQPDPPQVLLRFLGEEQFRETGAQLSWIAPTPFYLETVLGLFNGDNEVSFGNGRIRDPLVTGRVRTFFELTDTSAFQVGASVASGMTADRFRTTLVGLDAKYKYHPDGWLHPLLTLGGEALYSRRNTEVFVEGGDGSLIARDRRLDRWGMYAYGEVQPFRRWAGGLRYDWTEYPLDPGHEWAVEPYLVFKPSDFLRFRLAYKHTDRSVALVTDRGRIRSLDEIFLQATFFLGAHPAHPF